MNPALHFTPALLGQDATATPASLSVVPMQFVIAGWTGRNAEAIEHHIQELAALGIAPGPTRNHKLLGHHRQRGGLGCVVGVERGQREMQSGVHV